MRFGLAKKTAAFTPSQVSKALGAPKQDVPLTPEVQSKSSAPVVVHLDAKDIIHGFVQAARFLDGYAKRRQESRQQELDALVLSLAKSFKGFVGLPDLLVGERCDRAQALSSFERLQRTGNCQWLCHYQGEPLYVFPAFLVKAWTCHHCGSKFPAQAHEHDQGNRTCPCCGAPLELIVE